MADKVKKGPGSGLVTGCITLLFILLGGILFMLSYRTGYYTFGEMNSTRIAVLIAAAAVLVIANMVLERVLPKALWARFLTFGVTACLAAAAMILIGDRVEGIGNCIITDYDSGHGGEEAIYRSLAGSVSLLLGMIYNIIGSFAKDAKAPAGLAKTLGLSVPGAALFAVVTAAAVMLSSPQTGGSSSAGNAAGGADAGSGGETAAPVAAGEMRSGTYKITFAQEFENVGEGDMPTFQFLTAGMDGLCRADSRFYVDIELNLDGQGGYTLSSEAYVIESGKKAEIGDDTGLGLIYQTKAEGTYTDFGGGSVATAAADHVSLALETDTYSEQMKPLMKLDEYGIEADGEFDSADMPDLLKIVPETMWTLDDAGAIGTYAQAAKSGTFTITYAQEFENVGEDDMPEYQFLTAGMGGLCRADSRFYVDIVLELDGQGTYSLHSEAYVIESGKRAEIGDDTGLGLIYETTSEGAYEEDEDGNIVTEQASHVSFVLDTDTYSEQMKPLMGLEDLGITENGTFDSADLPDLLDIVPKTEWTLSGSDIVTYEKEGRHHHGDRDDDNDETESEDGAQAEEESAEEPVE